MILLPRGISHISQSVLRPRVQLSLPPSSHQDTPRPLAPAQFCPSSALHLLWDAAFVPMESKSSPRPGHLPRGESPLLVRLPNQQRFSKPILRLKKKKKKFQFQPSPVSPRPVPPSNSRSQSGLRSGSSRRAGVLQPRFFPWTQLQPWLFGNPGEFSRR